MHCIEASQTGLPAVHVGEFLSLFRAVRVTNIKYCSAHFAPAKAPRKRSQQAHRRIYAQVRACMATKARAVLHFDCDVGLNKSRVCSQLAQNFSNQHLMQMPQTSPCHHFTLHFL